MEVILLSTRLFDFWDHTWSYRNHVPWMLLISKLHQINKLSPLPTIFTRGLLVKATIVNFHFNKLVGKNLSIQKIN